jgi:hypothetical protein
MGLVNDQWAFLQDIAALIEFIKTAKEKASGGEFWRPDWVEEEYRKQGLSKTADGRNPHGMKLAFDIHFFDQDGNLNDNDDFIKPFADYWKGLSPQNIWGGDWHDPHDPCHFERKPS